MAAYIVTDGRTLSGDRVDLEIRDGQFDRVVPAGEGDPSAFPEDRRYDADGRLVTPPLIEPHTHLDLALTAGNPYWNETNTLEEGWRIWEKQREEVTKADFKRRARKVIKWFVASGVTRVRTHLNVNTLEESFLGLEAMLELREELDVVDLQLGIFPFDCLMTTGDDRQLDLYEESLRRGIDVAGGVPHKEYTDEDGIAHVKAVVDLAEKHGCPLDLHIDETDDPQSRFTEVLASEALKRGIGDRTTASHATAMHSYSNAYADKLIRIMADSGMAVVTNPMSNAVLQGRYDDYPRRRGHTRIDELRAAGVPVAIGQDDVDAIWEMLTEGNATVYGADDYGLADGNRGSLVVYDGRTPFDVLRTRPPRTLVLKDGRAVARTDRTATVTIDGEDEAVDYAREA